METPVLDECLYLLSFYEDDENEDVFQKMVASNLNNYMKLEKPLAIEINSFLLAKESKNGKRDMLKFFISQFVGTALMFKKYGEILKNSHNGQGLKWEITNLENNQTRSATPMECYVLCSLELYAKVFDVFQNCCITYDIGFFELLEEMGFSKEGIEGSITIIHENNKYRQLNGIPYEDEDPRLPWQKVGVTLEESKKNSDPLKNFDDIFVIENWHKYIAALEYSDPPLLNNKWEFIGKPRGHKGVICSWITTLKYKGIVNQRLNRSQLAEALNNEIKFLNLGKDGKTLDNVSGLYEEEFQNQLFEIVNPY